MPQKKAITNDETAVTIVASIIAILLLLIAPRYCSGLNLATKKGEPKAEALVSKNESAPVEKKEREQKEDASIDKEFFANSEIKVIEPKVSPITASDEGNEQELQAKKSRKKEKEQLLQIERLKLEQLANKNALVSKLASEKEQLALEKKLLEEKHKATVSRLERTVQELNKKLEAGSAPSDDVVGRDLVKQSKEYEKEKEELEAKYKVTIDSLKSKVSYLSEELGILRKKQINESNSEEKKKSVLVSKNSELGSDERVLIRQLRASEPITQKSAAQSLGKIKFATGSSSLSSKGKNLLDEIIQKTLGKKNILVIGYADLSGNTALNQKISSERAEEVAGYLHKSHKQGDKIQAFYYGETSRFGSAEEENRVVEVWNLPTQKN